MFGSKSKINNFFQLNTSIEKNETISKHTSVDTSEFRTLNAESVDNRERIRIREYHELLSELFPSQICKVVRYAMILLTFNITSSQSYLDMFCRIFATPFTN